MKIEALNKGIEIKNEISTLQTQIRIMLEVPKENTREKRRIWRRGDDPIEVRSLVVTIDTAYEDPLAHTRALPPKSPAPHYSLFMLTPEDLAFMIKIRQDRIDFLQATLEKL